MELEKVKICREAVGYDFDFILEAHRGMTLPEAVTENKGYMKNYIMRGLNHISLTEPSKYRFAELLPRS